MSGAIGVNHESSSNALRDPKPLPRTLCTSSTSWRLVPISLYDNSNIHGGRIATVPCGLPSPARHANDPPTSNGPMPAAVGKINYEGSNALRPQPPEEDHDLLYFIVR